MRWLNIEAAVFRRPEFAACTPGVIGTWARVLGWCVEQENGGVIKGAASWNDRLWAATCCVNRREVGAARPLLQVDGGDVHVAFYPLEQESEMRARRARARENGRSGGRPPATVASTDTAADLSENTPEGKPTLVPASVAAQKPTLPPTLEPVSRSERKGNRKGNNLARPASPSATRDELFNCLAVVEGSQPEHLTAPAARAIAVALAQIRRVAPSITCAEIRARALEYRRVMPSGTRITAMALAKHWAKCGGKPVLAVVENTATVSEPPDWRVALQAVRPGNTFDGAWAVLPPSIQEEVRAHIANGGAAA